MSEKSLHTIGRLKKRPDFLAAASGRRFHTERMSVQGRIRPLEEVPQARLRFGLTVTKRVGHATERNRIKRRLRDAMAKAAVGHEGTMIDIVVIGRRSILYANHGMLVDDLTRALRAVSIPKGSKQ